MFRKHKALIAFVIVLLVLVIDQIIKIEVKTSMYLGQRHEITSFFSLVFVENDGMAFGWKIGTKLFLTIFRIIAVGVLTWYLCKLVKMARCPVGFIICIAAILAGAAGNIIDCLFYGLIFNDPKYPLVAQFVPWGEGYSEFLTGKVVDMFYFPLIEWNMPGWMPIYGGEHCVFFSPIFNFADASISCGVIALLLFYPRLLNKMTKKL